jgi:hypothetical protein
MQDKYSMHSDGEKVWLEVPFRDLVHTKIAHVISNASYIKGLNVFLDKDIDATKFIQGWEHLTGKKWNWKNMIAFKRSSTPLRVQKCIRYNWLEGAL